MSKLEEITDFPIGTKLELTVIDPIEGKLNIGFISQIEGFIDENVIRISAPIFEAKVYPIRLNSHIEGYLFYKSNQIYRIAGYVQNRLIVDDIALLDLRIVEKMKKIQRRQFFRFTCSVPVTLYIPLLNTIEEDIREIAGNTIDLSGGGLSAFTFEPLENDTVLKGKLELDDNRIIDFNGKVIRCVKNRINDKLTYVSSICFIDIDYKMRERIVAFIFNQQRLLLKKELR